MTDAASFFLPYMKQIRVSFTPSIMSFRLSNEKMFIRILNVDTGIVSLVNKAGLHIQKDNSNSFSLKSEGYVGFFKFDDIQSPTTGDLDALVTTLMKWVEDMVSQEASMPTADKLLDIRTNYKSGTADDLYTLTDVDGGLSFDASRSMHEMSVEMTEGSRVVRQSKEYIPNAFVANVLVMTEAVLNTSPEGETVPPGVIARVGVYDDANDVTVDTATAGKGAFFKYDENGLSAVYRVNDGSGGHTETVVPAVDFNLDKLDGTGLSGFTLDTRATNVFVFKWDNVSKKLSMGILAEDSVYYAHEFKKTGSAKPLGVPLRWEIVYDAATPEGMTASPPITMFQGKAHVFYTDNTAIHVRGLDSGTSPIIINDTPKPIFSVRLRDATNRAKINPQKLSLVNIASTGVAKWELVKNATLTDASFSDVSDSFAQMSTSETDATDGKVVTSGYVINAGASTFDLEKHGIVLTSDISGTSDTLTLRIVLISGTVDILGSIDWIERD